MKSPIYELVWAILRKFRRSVRYIYRRWRFSAEFRRFRMASKGQTRFDLKWSNRYSCLDDATEETGFDAHYIYHPAWAARLIARDAPEVHIDISSSLAFCTMLSAFIPVRFYDFRPALLFLTGLESQKADLTQLPFESRTVTSVSCMHVVEHIGLGRYGDPLDPEGDLKAMRELSRVLAPGGRLYFVVPVGRPEIRYNAHRIYSFEQIESSFDDLKLESFALLPDDFERGLLENATAEDVALQKYGCGCFCFTRPL